MKKILVVVVVVVVFVVYLPNNHIKNIIRIMIQQSGIINDINNNGIYIINITIYTINVPKNVMTGLYAIDFNGCHNLSANVDLINILRQLPDSIIIVVLISILLFVVVDELLINIMNTM